MQEFVSINNSSQRSLITCWLMDIVMISPGEYNNNVTQFFCLVIPVLTCMYQYTDYRLLQLYIAVYLQITSV